MIPSIGRIVHYRLNSYDAQRINARRAARVTAAKGGTFFGSQVPGIDGTQTHEGNEAREGDVYPFMITRVWGDTPESSVNGQLFLDGNDTLWLTSASQGSPDENGKWSEPPRVTAPRSEPLAAESLTAEPDAR